MIEEATKALFNDAAAILELQKLAFQSEAQFYDDFDIPPLTQTLDELTEDFAEKTFLKVEIKDKIVGSVRGYQTGDTCHIERLIVHPDYQGKGIGTALMKQIELCFENAQHFELFTGYKSERNINLYERLGYRIFKSEEINKKLSFVFMEKRQVIAIQSLFELS
jgi:ribosomal protein S18 acetylase RimI-like enzyme